MDSEPVLNRLEEQVAYLAFGELAPTLGMAVGRITMREKVAWLDEQGYDRNLDRPVRKFFLRCFKALDDERQSYYAAKHEDARKK